MSVPTTMQVVDITDFGPPDNLEIRERPVPRLAPGEVLVEVAAAGVNRADVMQRRGHYPPPMGASDVLGLEISGTVAAVGPEVSTLKAGDQVCALVTGGGYAEYCAAPAPQCLPVPAGVDVVDAAALPEAYFTVWTNVFDRGRLQAGESFLYTGVRAGSERRRFRSRSSRGPEYSQRRAPPISAVRADALGPSLRSTTAMMISSLP